MRALLSEKNLVVILFVLVLITFSFAQEDSKKMQSGYSSEIQNINISSTGSQFQQKPGSILAKTKNQPIEDLK